MHQNPILTFLSSSPSPVPPVPPPLPAPDYPGSVLSASNKMYNWKEVTSDFRDAVKELTLGELLHDDLFGLFEAMSAIEMMDPKMDAGMRCNRQERRPLNFKTAAEEGHLKLKDLSAAEQGRHDSIGNFMTVQIRTRVLNEQSSKQILNECAM